MVPAGATMAQLAIRWILMHGAVACAIPGAKRPAQIDENVAAAELLPLDPPAMARIRELYDREIRPQVHQRW